VKQQAKQQQQKKVQILARSKKSFPVSSLFCSFLTGFCSKREKTDKEKELSRKTSLLSRKKPGEKMRNTQRKTAPPKSLLHQKNDRFRNAKQQHTDHLQSRKNETTEKRDQK
jgi:hypothetical protein